MLQQQLSTYVSHQSSATAFHLAPIPRSSWSWWTANEQRPQLLALLSLSRWRHRRRHYAVHIRLMPALRSSSRHSRQHCMLAPQQPPAHQLCRLSLPSHDGTRCVPAESGRSQHRRNQSHVLCLRPVRQTPSNRMTCSRHPAQRWVHFLCFGKPW